MYYNGSMNPLTFEYRESALVDDVDIAHTASALSEYQKHLQNVSHSVGYDFAESSINLPFDTELHQRVADCARDKDTGNLKYIIVVGIGGSNLGARAVYEGLRGIINQPFPKIIFADTLSSKLFDDASALFEGLKEEEILVNVISKSGTTTETIAFGEAFIAALKDRMPRIYDRVVVTTDEGSKLWNSAKEKNFALLAIPKNVCGRYSVMSAVGLFPLLLARVNIGQVAEGARLLRDLCISGSLDENIALVSASLIHIHALKGSRINDNFFFIPELESVGKWYRQLMGESLGKERDTEGVVVHRGITPTVSIGPTDLHSMAQLYLAGPRDKFTNFVVASNIRETARVPKALTFPGLVGGIEGKSFVEIMNAIYGGIRAAYCVNQIPFMEVKMPSASEYTIGAYFQFKMLEMMYLARLTGVNAFDEPNVEEYKKETRKLLGS